MGATIGAACGLIVAVVWALGVLRPLDLRLHDWFYQVRGPVRASDRIAIVEIDDQTIRALGDVWPLPRRHYAVAIDALENAGAAAVAFDLLFLGESGEDPVGDQLLASVIAQHDNLVPAIGLQRSDAPITSEMALAADSSALIRFGRPVGRQRLAVAQSVSMPYDDLLAAAHDVGHTTALIDDDGVVRRIPHYIRFGDMAYGSLVTGLLEVAARGDSTLPRFELAPEGLVFHWKGRRVPVPCDREGATPIAFAGEQGAFKNRHSLLQLLQWYRDDDTTALARAFRDKWVLMGATATGQHASDVGPTPYTSTSPLVYIHANAVNAALHGRFLRKVPAVWVIVLLIALGVGLGLSCSRLSLLHAGLVALGAVLAILIVDFGLFVFGDVDLPALGVMLVAPVTWAAVANAWGRETERRERERAKELQVARSIQQHLLPSKPPKIAGLDVSGRNIPASSVGGDYFDWVSLEDGSVAVVVGDVSGHGIPAALLMAHIHASFHAVAQAGRTPEQMVESVNRSLARAALPGKFATFFLGVISVEERRLRYCNAGHNSPLLLRDGQVIELGANGVPLAVMEHMPYSGSDTTFVEGDTLVIYSDGIPEAPQQARPKEFYGDDRLKERALALSAAHPNAAEIVEKLIADVRAVAGDGMHVDDVTLVVVRRT
jgi:CHASE2 domain-containing sensor protein